MILGIGQYLDLSTQLGDLGVQLLDLIEQLNDAQVLDRLLNLLQARVVVTILLLGLRAQIFNIATRFVIIEQASGSVKTCRDEGEQECGAEMAKWGVGHGMVGSMRLGLRLYLATVGRTTAFGATTDQNAATPLLNEKCQRHGCAQLVTSI